MNGFFDVEFKGMRVLVKEGQIDVIVDANGRTDGDKVVGLDEHEGLVQVGEGGYL